MTTTTDPTVTTTSDHTLHVLDQTGDTRTIWNTENQAEVDAAKETFKRLKKKGYLAYTVDESGERGEVITEFDPEAGRIIMAPQLVGG
jgi:hypothetical protein